MIDDLPPLPEPARTETALQNTRDRHRVVWYSAHQMQAYARAAIEQDRERQSVPAAQDAANLLSRYERHWHRMGELWERCQGKGWPAKEGDEFAQLRDERAPATRAALLAFLAAPQPAQESEYCDPSSTIYKLAEMVMSDCGCSSDHQRLLDRIAARIQSHIDTIPQAPQSAGSTAEDVAKVARNRGLDEALGELALMYDKADQASPLHKGMRMALSSAYDRVKALMQSNTQAPQPQPVQQEPVAWWYAVGDKVHLETSRLDHYHVQSGEYVKGMPLVFANTEQPLTPEWYARWIRNNYQDHPNIATLCEELTKAAHGITKGTA
jgi:hypothetical protein